jgi:molecular chaperone GrpE
VSTEQPDNAGDQDPKTAATPASEQDCEIPSHDHEMARLQRERDQFEDQLKRSMADSANMRRRQQKEVEDARRRGLEGLAQQLLPVLDNFSAALQAFDEQADRSDVGALVEGVRMVRGLLQAALERSGMQEIPAVGRAFDPNVHEAVAVEPRRDVSAGQITKVLQAGYQIGDRVIRPSRVLVAGEPPAAPD